jgi:hypothetical protein
MMNKKRALWVAVFAIGFACWVPWAFWQGVIPDIAQTTDDGYGKLCGIKPSAGYIWCYTFGWVDCITYYRLQLTPAAFAQRYGVAARKGSFIRPRSSPWWWAPPVPYEVYIIPGRGLGPGDERIDVYDPKRGLLYVRSEW